MTLPNVGYRLSPMLKVLVDDPTVCLCLLLVIRFWNLPAFLLFLCSLGVYAFWRSASIGIHNSFLYNQLLVGYLKQYPGCKFTLIPIKEHFEKIEKGFLEYFERYRPQRLLKRPIGWFCLVERIIPRTPFPSTLTTFPFAVDPAYVMIRDHPKDFTDYQTFSICHELGHLSYQQQEIYLRSYEHPIQLLLNVIIVLILTDYALSALLLPFISFVLWSFYTIRIRKVDFISELLADVFAVFHMANNPKFDEMYQQFLNYVKRTENNSATALIRENFLGDYKSSIDDVKRQKYKYKKIDYNPYITYYVEHIYTCPRFIYIIQLILLVLIAFQVSVISYSAVLLLLAPLIVAPLIIHIFLTVIVVKKKAEIERLLHV